MRAEVYAMINRWLDKGVDGFRMDVISLLAKAPGMPDGEGEGYVFSEQYFAFQPKLHEYLREMRQNCFVGRDCMCVGETTFVTTHQCQLCGWRWTGVGSAISVRYHGHRW